MFANDCQVLWTLNSLEKLQKISETTREGSNLANISSASERIGFRTLGVKVNLKKLIEDAPLPCIVHWKQNHFVVVYQTIIFLLLTRSWKD